MKKHQNKKRNYALIGLNTFGKKIADVLSGERVNIIIVDKEENTLYPYKDMAGVTAISADMSNIQTLHKLGLEEVETAVVAIGNNVAESILVTTGLRTLGVPEIIARARSPEHVRALRRVGATKVVFPEEDTAERVAHSMLAPEVKEFFEVAENFDIIQVSTPEELVGKTLDEIKLNETFGLNVVAIKHPSPDTAKEETVKEQGFAELANMSYNLRAEDILVVAGKTKDIEKFADKMYKEKFQKK